jgi:hypothetical protein
MPYDFFSLQKYGIPLRGNKLSLGLNIAIKRRRLKGWQSGECPTVNN